MGKRLVTVDNQGNIITECFNTEFLSTEQLNSGILVEDEVFKVEVSLGKAPVFVYDHQSKKFNHYFVDVKLPHEIQEEKEPTLADLVEQVSSLKNDNLILMEAFATLYETIVAQQNGGSV